MRKKNLKNKTKGVGEKEKRFFHSALSEEIRKWILGVVLFLVAVIVTLSFFDKAGIAGENLMKILTFLIGKAAFVIPLVLVLGGIVFLNPKYRKSLRPAFFAQIFLILAISGLLGSINPTLKEGGLVGYFITLPFLKLFGELASKIIFGALIIISGILFWSFLGKPVFIKKSKTEEVEGAEKKPVFIKKIFGPKFKVKEVPSFPQIDLSSSQAQAKQDQILLDFKIKPIESASRNLNYQFPPTDLLEKDRGAAFAGDIKINSAIIKRTLQNFDIQVEISEVNVGPTVTQYALKPAEGVKLSKITVLSNDLSLALASHPIRIEAPIPGRPLVGIEVPNKTRATVRLRELIEHPNFQNSGSSLIFCLGRDVSGLPVFADISRMPHLLVAGATGTGKTICLNSIILSLLYRNDPENLKLILIDPKRVEFPIYNDIPHLLCPVIVDPQKTINSLKWLIGEMERRFEILSQAKARDVAEFNQIYFKKPDSLERMPYIVLIVDELADLMAARGREMEAGVVRLAQMARAVGIHLILATQRPSVEVITGLIKANITSRIAFQVASQVDSRTVFDIAGAEKLLGLGDMLFISAEIVKPRRIQGAYVSEKEIKKVVSFIVSNSKLSEERKDTPLLLQNEDGTEKREKRGRDLSSFLESGRVEAETPASLAEALEEPEFLNNEDPLYEEAKKLVIEARKASASLLQRRLRIGYARAARLIDTLEERGVVGPGEGAKPREVYI
ncbi:MAG: cell division protein FtsK [Candidatus Nealsonbacteria bacterium CG_4_9_14_0_2_um_filter_37_38]|uniref:Cell division protein FtsK n=1 Tax=Candidatus Nealsonbacteria bacterium CG_4_10_14_0_8_um_filter_37_14 TaxID=1974684 RepID=A0A2M7R7B1_9BACT|nr:MAG: cell division protein FtsK [Candidatus Nealsonbacteria bacterium CG11_big_fil_rev_8_21_14_0_20_37_68]PIW92223.1 MAG: cell division protein FtsK [Candidatus Nealsonbacteria bacterium CG_4_8_14_3_um_filter_37_23]PIY89206.1 MAG: cell division protein FtsK [Candidatus Nealsonbacteria bacterium CG_4_10_14_0_8_um_filter_37_14]PJC51783.1 MAG: cell division protein FtsK [Candidatus Nealsonbacteria bacterium CG_4_9_14_0_2_um_filter_37_38]